jgi:hypothetical protein
MNSRRPTHAGTRPSRCIRSGARRRDPKTHHSAPVTSLVACAAATQLELSGEKKKSRRERPSVGLASLMRPLGPLPECRSWVCRYDVARAMPRRSLRRYWPGGVMSSPSFGSSRSLARPERAAALGSGQSLCRSVFRALHPSISTKHRFEGFACEHCRGSGLTGSPARTRSDSASVSPPINAVNPYLVAVCMTGCCVARCVVPPP